MSMPLYSKMKIKPHLYILQKLSNLVVQCDFKIEFWQEGTLAIATKPKLLLKYGENMN